VTNPAATSPFAPTRWTLVLRARGDSAEAKAALSELCEGYYTPVLRFLRREGREEDAAQELAQEFFARVLSGTGFASADPERGRFRSYLLGALKHFLGDQRDRERRQKRGGGAEPEPLETSTDTSPGLDVADPSAWPPDAWFDREWALAVMDRALGALATEFAKAEKAGQFEALRPWLVGETPSLSQAEAATRLGLSEGAVKVAVHRLRRRFRELVKAEIAHTLPNPADVESELRHLVAALAS
jgi:RNA polymerase sigma-70 factor (ECF subfamily)